MFTQSRHNNFNIVRYFPDSSKGKLARLGGITGIHRNEIGPVCDESGINEDHPLIHALKETKPNIQMTILTDPFAGLIPEGQRLARTGDYAIDPNRIAGKVSPTEFDFQTRRQRAMLSALLRRSGEIVASAKDLFQTDPVLSLHADQPHEMTLNESLFAQGNNSYTYGYIAWNTRAFSRNHIQGLWNSFTSSLPATSLIARNKYLLEPEQALGNIDMKIRNGLIKLPDPISDGTFENQLVVEGISPLTICYELPLAPLHTQQEIMANFLRRFLSPLLLK
jgi:hypothetical protein